jgi:hypothetical protein
LTPSASPAGTAQNCTAWWEGGVSDLPQLAGEWPGYHGQLHYNARDAYSTEAHTVPPSNLTADFHDNAGGKGWACSAASEGADSVQCGSSAHTLRLLEAESRWTGPQSAAAVETGGSVRMLAAAD